MIIAGWHALQDPGPDASSGLFTNITTYASEVASLAAQYAIESTENEVGAVILTDSRFEIALAKSDEMARIVDQCGRCKVLEIVDVPLSEVGATMPDLIERLAADYGAQWNVTLGINDLYFDEGAVPFAVRSALDGISTSNISAGDGSPSAFGRIQSGEFQTATVTEPLGFQGWQLAYEINRALHGLDESGHVASPAVIDASYFEDESRPTTHYEPDFDYKTFFTQGWLLTQ